MLTEIPTIDTVITTGHSLGGALAVLCAFDLSIEFKANEELGEIKIPNKYGIGESVKRYIKCFTFGAPRVGNSHFRTAFHSEVGIENCVQGVKNIQGSFQVTLRTPNML